jgi:isopentenyl-diphosphate Delta-isomerase
MPEQVILVDEQDRELGIMEKLAAHQHGGTLHRCFSTIILNSKGEMLLQQRAKGKYHSGGLWANACCSHPRPGEDAVAAAERRLVEELGISCRLREIATFIYRAELDHDLVEHEFDHLMLGKTDEEPEPNPEEVMEHRWMSIPDIQKDIKVAPERYAPWFKRIMELLAQGDFSLLKS